jgi:hypothetical protein
VPISLSLRSKPMEISPKFIKRWAEIYVKKLLEDKPGAQEWARRFLPRELIDAVGAESKIILKKKGYKVVD